MDAPWPSSAFMLVKSRLDVRELTATKWRRKASVTTGSEWATVECTSKRAYGCGKHGQKLVEGLTLYVRRLVESPDLTSSPSMQAPDLTSALSISLSAEAARSIEAEVCAPGGKLEVKGSVMMSNQHLLILLVIFSGLGHGKLAYYLVFDSTNSSLYMIPYLPAYLEACYTLCPIPVSTTDGHVLVLMAREVGSGLMDEGLVCLCTPATRASSASDSTGTWRMMKRRFPKLPQPFVADEMFSLGSMVFWADLSQGLVYCDLLHMEGSVVDFHFIKLPDGYEINYNSVTHGYLQTEPEPRKMSRTIGRTGSSIKFVCIDRRWAHPGNETVKSWTLDLQHRRWKSDEGFPCPWNAFWKHGSSLNIEVKDVEPQYPTLGPDGALCLLLRWRNSARGMEETCYICSFEMRRRSPLWFGLVQEYCTTGPFFLPCNFFTTKLYRRPERKYPIFVNSKEIPSCKRINLSSDSLIEIKDMRLIFHVNPDAVKQYISHDLKPER